MIEARLNGLFPPDFAASERIDLPRLWARGGGPPPAPVQIADARLFQAGTDEAGFLDAHGFVLLDAPTRVTDWGDQSQVADRYFPEVEKLIRDRLFPGRKLAIFQPPRIVRRGAGTDSPQYGDGVHCDFATSAEDFQHNIAAFASSEAAAQWRHGYEGEGVAGFVMLDFWRTTGMAAPLRHMPLAVCDAGSVDPADIVPTTLDGIAPGGATTRHIGLRRNPAQAWYHYSGMTADEVLVFKLFQLMRGEDPQRFRACLHSAFVDPNAPAGAPPRQSCEHRVSVLLLD